MAEPNRKSKERGPGDAVIENTEQVSRAETGGGGTWRITRT